MRLQWIKVVTLLTAIALPNAAFAQQLNIFGAILNGIAISQAQKAWDQEDSSVRDCLLSQYRISTSQLAQRAIGPTNTQVVDYVNNCKRMIAQQQADADRAKAAEEQRQEEATQADQQRQEQAAEEEKQQEQRAAEEAKEKQDQAAKDAKEAKAAAAAQKAQDAKRYAGLQQKYGVKDADAISHHTVLIGMTKDQVEEAVGQPVARQVVPPSDELWKYETGQVVLTNGHVTYVSLK